jgi:hypothetical protein
MKPARPHPSSRFADWLWPWVIDLWMAAVLVMFLVIRVLGSNTTRHALHVLMSH